MESSGYCCRGGPAECVGCAGRGVEPLKCFGDVGAAKRCTAAVSAASSTSSRIAAGGLSQQRRRWQPDGRGIDDDEEEVVPAAEVGVLVFHCGPRVTFCTGTSTHA